MADSLARAQLARAARRLDRVPALPSLVLLTDDERLPNPAPALAALPRGSMVIVRSRERPRRLALAALVARAAREHGLAWIVADDPELASVADAGGAHFPERDIRIVARWRARRPQWLITCSAHSLQNCLCAGRAGVDAVLLSPVFATPSHPLQPWLGSIRVRLIAQAVPVPIYALGGIDSRSARRFRGAPLAGFAAIAGLAPDGSVRPGRCAPATATV